MTDKEYNGWTNYETWNVALWIDNERGTQNDRRERARPRGRARRDHPTGGLTWPMRSGSS